MRREGDDYGPSGDPGGGRGDPGGGRDEPGRPKRSGVSFRQVVIAVVAIILIAFGVANFDRVEVTVVRLDVVEGQGVLCGVALGGGRIIDKYVGRPGRLQRRYLKDRERDIDKD
mgnify:CR=1 FL=1